MQQQPSSQWNPSDYQRVGKVKDAHGLRGELYLLLFSKRADWLDKMDCLYLSQEDEEKAQVFSVQKARPHKSGLIAQLEGVVNRNQAEELKGLFVYVPQNWLVSKPGESLYLGEVQGFVVEDSSVGKVGVIHGFQQNGAQDLLLVKGKGDEEHLIPFVEAFIEKIDWENRRILMNLPEGLLELAL